MPYRELQSTFAGGELSPALYGRVDLAKYETGAALVRNFLVQYQGGVTYRPGTEYITTGKTEGQPPRLIPFIVGTEASYVLEFGDGYIRYISNGVVVMDGSSPLETVTPYAYADLALLKYTQSADVLTLTHPSYAPANLTRTGDQTFEYAEIEVGPGIVPPTVTDCTATNGGDFFYGYLVTAVDLDGKEESLASNPVVDTSEIQDETANKVIRLHWTPPSQAISVYNIYKWGPIGKTTDPASVWGWIGQARTTSFVDNNIAPDFSKQPPNWGDPFSGGQFETINVNAAGSGYVNGDDGFPDIPYVPLSISGDGTDAAGYAAIQSATGTVTGVWLTNTGKNYTTATVTANGEGGTGATFTFTFTSLSPLYPGCCAYYQQRQVFAGSNIKPETIVFSNVGRYTNFNTTPVALDTDAIVVSIASQEVNTVLSLVPSAGGLLAFTTGGSFVLNGGSPGEALTPSNITAQPQSFTGASNLQPLRIEYDVLYVQAKGNHVRDLAFNWQRQTYTGSDISALASHLFDGFEITEWCWAQEPFKSVWAVRDDGRLLTLTYLPDQEVFAWSRQDTQGLFKSVCSVPEGDVNAVYVTVMRHLENDEGDPCWVSYIERFATPALCCILDAWHLDSALSTVPSTFDYPLFLSGLEVGETVTITSYDPCVEPAPTIGPFMSGAATVVDELATAGDGTYTVTAGVTSIIVEGIAGGQQGSKAFGKGGAGGGYGKVTMAVTPGQMIAYHVANGVAGSNSVLQAIADVTWWGSGTITDAACKLYVTGGGSAGAARPTSSMKGDVLTAGGDGGVARAGGGASGPSGRGGAGGGVGAGGGGTAGGGGGGGGDGGANGAWNSGGTGGTGGAGGPFGGAGGNGGNYNHGVGTNGTAGTGYGPSSNKGPGGGGGQGSDANGGNGALYGGGGGATGNASFGGAAATGGSGAQGIIWVTRLGTPANVVNPGDVIQVNCGLIRVVTVDSAVSITGEILSDLDLDLPNDPTQPTPVDEGDWAVFTPSSTFSGLDHLEGKEVWALADGLVVGPLTVESGDVTLPFEATKVVVGLKYAGQVKTLYLTTEGLSHGSNLGQGQRKLLQPFTARVECTRGLEVGPDFDSLTPIPDLELPITTPSPLRTGDFTLPIHPTWTETGEICIQQDVPLPATVLGVIVGVVMGDTQR